MKKENQPLTNVQLEVLKAFSYNLNDSDLSEFKDTVAEYFAKKAISSADKVWEDKEWSSEDVDEMLETKMRKNKKE
jgi:hypothetical protein